MGYVSMGQLSLAVPKLSVQTMTLQQPPIPTFTVAPPPQVNITLPTPPPLPTLPTFQLPQILKPQPTTTWMPTTFSPPPASAPPIAVAQPAPPTPPKFTPAEVMEIQQSLKALGLYAGPIDGDANNKANGLEGAVQGFLSAIGRSGTQPAPAELLALIRGTMQQMQAQQSQLQAQTAAQVTSSSLPPWALPVGLGVAGLVLWKVLK